MRLLCRHFVASCQFFNMVNNIYGEFSYNYTSFLRCFEYSLFIIANSVQVRIL